ncbi:hypothetical protein K488DRAFT_24029, partial [Vararia minispora EC-137]
RKRPRLDLSVNPRERKRGKTVFGLVVGTLTKAKNEDKARSASEAAKKRQEIEERLQNKLKKETDSVRRAEEIKKDKATANRREEELQLKDSIYKLRRTRLPLLANFLSTSDLIPAEDADPNAPSSRHPLSFPPRSQPAPLFYLPAVLLPAQEALLTKRRVEVREAAEKEWETFHEERTVAVEEIKALRARVAEEDARKRAEREANRAEELKSTDKNKPTEEADADSAPPPDAENSNSADVQTDVAMDASSSEPTKEENKDKSTPAPERKEEPAPMQVDDDDAVEY